MGLRALLLASGGLLVTLDPEADCGKGRLVQIPGAERSFFLFGLNRRKQDGIVPEAVSLGELLGIRPHFEAMKLPTSCKAAIAALLVPDRHHLSQLAHAGN